MNCSLQVLQLPELGFSSEILLRIDIMIDQNKQGMISPLVLSMSGISEKFALQLRSLYLWAGHRHHTVHCSHFRLSSVAHSFYTQHADILTQYLAFLTRFVNRISILHPFCASESSTIARFTKLALSPASAQQPVSEMHRAFELHLKTLQELIVCSHQQASIMAPSLNAESIKKLLLAALVCVERDIPSIVAQNQKLQGLTVFAWEQQFDSAFLSAPFSSSDHQQGRGAFRQIKEG